MNQNIKVIVRVEYEQGEKQKVCYGEIEKKKIENFVVGEEDFICMENDGRITWLDKESVISVEMLHIKNILLLKPKIANYSPTDKNAGICF